MRIARDFEGTEKGGVPLHIIRAIVKCLAAWSVEPTMPDTPPELPLAHIPALKMLARGLAEICAERLYDRMRVDMSAVEAGQGSQI